MVTNVIDCNKGDRPLVWRDEEEADDKKGFLIDYHFFHCILHFSFVLYSVKFTLFLNAWNFFSQCLTLCFRDFWHFGCCSGKLFLNIWHFFSLSNTCLTLWLLRSKLRPRLRSLSTGTTVWERVRTQRGRCLRARYGRSAMFFSFLSWHGNVSGKVLCNSCVFNIFFFGNILF